MGNPIKSNEGIAQAYQGEIANDASGLAVDSFLMPSQTNLIVCSNAEICLEARESAVSIANSNLGAEASDIGALAGDFSEFDSALGQQNAQIGE